jgi:hypothetical protein
VLSVCFLCSVFMCVLFIVLCDLCFYVVLFLWLAIWLLTQLDFKHELNCNKLNCCQFLIFLKN